jgi:aminotransferase
MSMENDTPLPLSEKAVLLKQSGIRSVSRRCSEVGGINLGQGICDIPIHKDIKQAASLAIDSNRNTYSSYEGVYRLRQAIANKLQNFNLISADPKTEIMVSHGSTGAFTCAIQVLFNPGDEVILFEPFYGYHNQILEICGVTRSSVRVADDFTIDWDELESKITSKTRGIIICTPCNPNGKVFTTDELLRIGDIAKRNNLAVITDEIYEYFTYPGFEHVSFASLADHWQRTVSISGFSKTYNMTGWRLGYAFGPQAIVSKMILLHDLLYVCPPTPLQYAVIDALALDQSYYSSLKKDFLNKRDLIVKSLRGIGFKVTEPQGAYYVMANFSDLPFTDDEDAVTKILDVSGVAAVPGGAFFLDPESGKYFLRFCFALGEEKLNKAMQCLEKLKK